MMARPIEVRARGALFDGTAPAVVDEYLDAAKWAVARQGYVDIGMELRRVIREPTPFYWTQITIDRQQDNLVVHDQGVVYGPWLEGVGSRNKTTRFKGYWHWRRIRNRLSRKAHFIAADVLDRYLPRLGGGR